MSQLSDKTRKMARDRWWVKAKTFGVRKSYGSQKGDGDAQNVELINFLKSNEFHGFVGFTYQVL
jgi:hypothetical protein